MKWYTEIMKKVLENKLSLGLAVLGAVLCLGSTVGLCREMQMKETSADFYDNTYDAIMSREALFCGEGVTEMDTFSNEAQKIQGAQEQQEVQDMLDAQETLEVQAAQELQPEESGEGYRDTDHEVSECDDYIIISGTGICYPLRQGEDNSYYLNHLPDGRVSKYGSIFVDYQNTDNDFNTIIYGHNMKDGKMFGGLSNYYTVDSYAQKHSDLVVSRNGVRREYELCSVQKVPYDAEVYMIEPSDRDLWVEHLLTDSVIDFGVELSGQDSFVTLSTCGSSKTEKIVTVWREL